MLHIANFLNRMSRCGHIKDYHTFDILKREEQETETIRQWRRSRCDVGNRHRLRVHEVHDTLDSEDAQLHKSKEEGHDMKEAVVLLAIYVDYAYDQT